MKLNLLSIEGSRAYEKQNDVVPIRARTHYLTEQFLHYLTKIDLDGSSKLVICFRKSQKTQKSMSVTHIFMYQSIMLIKMYWIGFGRWSRI